MTAPPLPSFEELDQLARSLLASWGAYVAQDNIKSTGRTIPQAAYAFGLAGHAHRLAPHALAVIRQGLPLEASPLVRSVYECSLTAHWVAVVDDAVNRFYVKDIDERRKLINSMKFLDLPNFGPTEHEEALRKLRELEPVEETAAASFKVTCDDLEPGGEVAYSHYRLLCSLTHPSAYLLDHYFAELDQEPYLARRVEPEQPRREGWTALLIASLVWAGYAVALADPTGTRKAELEKAAARLGIAPLLSPSAIAIRRLNKQATAQ